MKETPDQLEALPGAMQVVATARSRYLWEHDAAVVTAVGDRSGDEQEVQTLGAVGRELQTALLALRDARHHAAAGAEVPVPRGDDHLGAPDPAVPRRVRRQPHCGSAPAADRCPPTSTHTRQTSQRPCGRTSPTASATRAAERSPGRGRSAGRPGAPPRVPGGDCRSDGRGPDPSAGDRRDPARAERGVGGGIGGPGGMTERRDGKDERCPSGQARSSRAAGHDEPGAPGR